jgi:hypothetical protein
LLAIGKSDPFIQNLIGALGDYFIDNGAGYGLEAQENFMARFGHFSGCVPSPVACNFAC